MPTATSAELLNRLLPRLYRSLPMYLRDARPWCPPGKQRLLDSLLALSADLDDYCRRLAAAVRREGGEPQWGAFPTQYVDLHDLDVQHLGRHAVAEQQPILSDLSVAIASLPPGRPDRELLEELRGNLTGHCDLLLTQLG